MYQLIEPVAIFLQSWKDIKTGMTSRARQKKLYEICEDKAPKSERYGCFINIKFCFIVNILLFRKQTVANKEYKRNKK